MSDINPAQPHIQQLRQHLMDTLTALKDRANPMEPDRARAVAQVASVLIDSAKVEVDYIKATNQTSSSFLEQPPDASVAHLGHTPGSGYTQGTVERLSNGVTRHTLKG